MIAFLSDTNWDKWHNDEKEEKGPNVSLFRLFIKPTKNTINKIYAYFTGYIS